MKQDCAPVELLCVHPVYGAIYQEGEFVQRGAVVGLTTDSRGVVIAPISGWIRFAGRQGSDLALCVEIYQQPDEYFESPSE